MVSNIYLNDAVKTGKFLMRRANHVTRKSPLLSGRLLMVTLISLACIGAFSCIYFVSTLLGEQAEGSLLVRTATKLRSRRSSVPLVADEGDEPVELAEEPLARAAQLALAKQDGRTIAEDDEDARNPELSRRRVVVLYTESGRINTGVWPAWASGDEHRSVLNWAAAGVMVEKQCPKPCLITHDNSMVDKADAVIVETVNHPKFGLGGQAFEWPPLGLANPRRTVKGTGKGGNKALTRPDSLPALGVFYYEPDTQYPGYAARDPLVADKVHFSVTAHRDASLPITLVCPWGRNVDDYLRPPPAKRVGRLLAYFSEHGVAPPYRRIVDELFAAAGDNIHAYSHRRNRETPAEAGGDPFQLSRRIDFVSTYKFLLVTDGDAQEDFLSPEWSQAFLAGTVPIYGGAPNAAAYAPGPRSFLSLDSFKTGQKLWEYIQAFESEGDGDGRIPQGSPYMRFFDWKRGATRAYEQDEGGRWSTPPLGTGQGVSTDADMEAAERTVLSWDRPLAPGRSSRDEPALTGSDRESFDADSVTAWRSFRSHLDHCVHYAECRVCDLVHRIT